MSWDASQEVQEMLTSLADFDTRIVNFAYGPLINSVVVCATAGFYGDLAMITDDAAIRSAGLATFVTPGNNAEHVGTVGCDNGVWDDGVFVQLAPGDVDGGFGSVTGFGTAKNSVVVGGRMKTSPGGATPSSGRGPTRDGRLKPDVMGIGGDDDSLLIMPSTPETYAGNVGVSFAAPQVTGAAALLLEHHRRRDPMAAPNPAVFKAVLANTAEDVGAENPDYSNGYGLIQISEAVSAADSFMTMQVAQGETIGLDLNLDVAGACGLRVMAVWNDLSSMGMASMELINDIDLSVLSGNQEVLPWVLSPSAPRNAARRAVNSRDNVEQVTARSPSGNEVVRLVGTNVMMGPQEVVVHWYLVPCNAGGDTDTGGPGDPGGCPCGARTQEQGGGFLLLLLGLICARRRRR